MGRMVQYLGPRSCLDDTAGVHNRNVVGNGIDHGEVVGYIDEGRTAGACQLLQKIEHARLRVDIEAGGRLVEHHHLRAACQRHRDGDALLLAAAQLKRIPPQQGRVIETDAAGDLRGDRSCRCLVGAVRREYLADLRIDAVARIETRIWVLRHIGDLRSAGLASNRGAELEEVGAVEHHRACSDPRSRPDVGKQCECCARLPATRFSHKRQDLAARNVESDLVDNVGTAYRFHAEPVDPKHWPGIRHRVLRSNGRRCGRRRRR
jgi:hypothetical protein